MKKTTSKPMTSKTVSWIFIALITVLFIGTGIGSWFMQSLMSTQLVVADHAKIDADLSTVELQRTQTLETYLEANQVAVNKANAIVAETKTYQYQNQIVNDLETYAAKAGVRVIGYSFPVETTAAKPDASGLKSVTAGISLNRPVPYASLLKFIQYIEQNNTKMQITDLSLVPDPSDGTHLTDALITLKVYVR